MRKLLACALFGTACFSVSNVPTPKSCPPGQASRYDGTEWQCEPAVPVCESGFPSWNGSAWVCGTFPFGDVTKPQCPGGFPAWNGTSWSCAVSAPPQCPGGFPSWSGNGWSCGTLPADLGDVLTASRPTSGHRRPRRTRRGRRSPCSAG